MYSDDETALPKNEEHFWIMTGGNFEHVRHILEDYEVQDRYDAMEFGKREPMQILGYRNTAEEYDQRDHFLELGRKVMPLVRRLIDKRELTLEFCQQWGILMYCHGFLASYLFDDSDDPHHDITVSKQAPQEVPHLLSALLAIETATANACEIVGKRISIGQEAFDDALELGVQVGAALQFEESCPSV